MNSRFFASASTSAARQILDRLDLAGHIFGGLGVVGCQILDGDIVCDLPTSPA